jgi:hypothetical protein
VTIDLDEQTNQAIVTIHWQGTRHTELPVGESAAMASCRSSSESLEVIRRLNLNGQWPDREWL